MNIKPDTSTNEDSEKRVTFNMADNTTGIAPSSSSESAKEKIPQEVSEKSDPNDEQSSSSSEADEDEDSERDITPLYMYPAFDDVENIEMYRPGGYHPVRLDDQVAGRYTIIHKLGYGGFATVWLARDTQEQKYVALKIIISNESKHAMKKDLNILKHLAKNVERPGGNFIDLPIEDFWITGPNGRHLCIVSEVAGPSIAHLTRTFEKKLEPEYARRMALQVTQCLAFLHSEKIGVAHGDLTTSNILLELSNLDSWPQEKLLELLGEPIGEKVRPYTGKTLGKSQILLHCFFVWMSSELLDPGNWHCEPEVG
jgi:Protein kinase domain